MDKDVHFLDNYPQKLNTQRENKMSKSIKKDLKKKLKSILSDELDVVRNNEEDFEYFEDRVNSSDEVYDICEELYVHFTEDEIEDLVVKYMKKLW